MPGPENAILAPTPILFGPESVTQVEHPSNIQWARALQLLSQAFIGIASPSRTGLPQPLPYKGGAACPDRLLSTSATAAVTITHVAGSGTALTTP